MSNIEALKEQARRHEQKEEWQTACDLYLRAIERLNEDEQPDIGLYNRVGDLLIRLGNYEQAVENFERATDLYLEAELPNNAIAICKKVLRHLPTRTETYLRMGKIRASQGFLVDARENFLTYAEKMQGLGEIDEALRAMVEFADIAADDTDTRMAVATQLMQHERTDEALTQLAAGYRILTARGDDDAAAAFEEKIREIDPEADLEALAGPAMGADTFAFETTALGSLADEGFQAEFGEIMVPDEPASGDAGSEPGAPERRTGFEGGDNAAGAVEEGIGEFGEISLEDDAASPEENLPFLVHGDEEDDAEEAAGEPEDLPLLSDAFDVGGEDEDPDVEEEPLPFLDLDHGDTPDSGETAGPPHGLREEPTAALEDAVEEASGPRASPREVWDSLRNACEADPSDVEIAQQLVEVAFKLDDPVALVESYVALASALRRTGNESRAQAVCKQVLSLDPDNAWAREALGEGPEESTGGGGAASSPTYVDLGALIFDEGETEKTTRFQVAYQEPTGDEEADFAKMLSQFKAKVAENFDLSDVKAHHDLGTAYKEMGLLDEAVEKFQQALRAEPGHLPTYEILGQTFMEKGELATAVKVLERALKVPAQVEDEFIGIYYYLGRAHQDLGHVDQAIEFFDRVFALDINFADVTERLRTLR